MSRPRIESLRREDRHCPVHGLTEFTRYGRRSGGTYYFWVCMTCHKERNKRNQALVKEHPERVTHRLPRAEPALNPVCPKCWTVITTTGTCLCD